MGRSRHGARWLWSGLPELAELKEKAPPRLRSQEKAEWANSRLGAMEDARIAELQGVLDGGNLLWAAFEQGELRLFAGGETVLGKIYLDDPEGKLAEAYWRFLLLRREARDAKPFSSLLRRAPSGPDTPAARQFLDRVTELVAETEAIRAAEREMNERLYGLYHLSPGERMLVESDCAARALL